MFALLTRLLPVLLAALPQEAGAGELVPQSSKAPAATSPQETQQRRLESLYEGALVGAVDWQDFTETPGYLRLLELVSQYKDQELREKAKVRLHFALALSSPDSWRGEIVQVRGLIVGLETVRLSQPIGEHVDCYRAVVAEADGSEGVIVDFLEPPPALELQRDVVDVEAVFFRTVRFENRRGTLTYAPHLVARSIRRLDQQALPRDTSMDTFGLVLGGAGLSYLVVRILMSLRSRKSREDQSRARASILIRQRAAQALPPQAASPSKAEHESC